MLKKVLALALAGAMVLGSMSLSAFAAPGDAPYDSTLTISGLLEGDVVSFYQVLGWEEAGAANATIPGSAGGWIYTSAFKDNMGSIKASDLTGRDNDGAGGITAEIAGQLARVASTPDFTATATADGIATHVAPAAGMYLALITPADPDYVYNPVIVSADYNTENPSASWAVTSSASYANKAAAKMAKLTIDKSADTSPEDAWDDGGQGLDGSQYTTAIGDSVAFTVKTTIPGYGKVYQNPQFVMTDTLTDMTLTAAQQAAITVTGVPAKFTPEGGSETDSYTIAPSASGYTITFAPAFLQTLTKPTDIIVSYTATVSTTALKNLNEEDNTVTIEYSHNPNNESDITAKKDTTQHYTFTIDAANLGDSQGAIGKSGSEIIKVGLDSDGRPVKSTVRTSSQITTTNGQTSPLAGAKFALYTDADCTQEYIPKNADGTPGSALQLESDENGRILIKGLDAGLYYLKETAAPAGYIKDQRKIPVEIKAFFKKDQEKTEWYYNGGWYGSEAEALAVAGTGNDDLVKEVTYKTDVLDYYEVWVDGVKAAKHTFMNTSEHSPAVSWIDGGETVELPSSIINRQGVELPSTGGIGTTLFYAGGAVLVLLAGVLLVSKRRIA